MTLPTRAGTTLLASMTLLSLLAGTSPTHAGTEAMPTTHQAAENAEAAVIALLRSYERALNAKDVATIVSLYAPDGVFMAQHRPPNVGSGAIAAAYEGVFGMITLDITFEIDEVEVVTPTVAWARTRSAGKTTILATGDVVSEGNQELFLLFRADESAPWQIGRYIFSTTQRRVERAQTHELTGGLHSARTIRTVRSSSEDVWMASSSSWTPTASSKSARKRFPRRIASAKRT